MVTRHQELTRFRAWDHCGTFASGCITPPPSSSGSSSSSIQVWVTPPAHAAACLDRLIADDDESSNYSRDPHMMRVSQYVFRSLNSSFMLLIKFMFRVQNTELENRLTQVENELKTMKEAVAAKKEACNRKRFFALFSPRNNAFPFSVLCLTVSSSSSITRLGDRMESLLNSMSLGAQWKASLHCCFWPGRSLLLLQRRPHRQVSQGHGRGSRFIVGRAPALARTYQEVLLIGTRTAPSWIFNGRIHSGYKNRIRRSNLNPNTKLNFR
jgi:hypothetical protein